jgi:glycosyltransferase involved in cell wall biosynthesis
MCRTFSVGRRGHSLAGRMCPNVRPNACDFKSHASIARQEAQSLCLSMKVLHILEATQGGTRRHVLDLLPALKARGVACDLIYSPERYPPFRGDAEVLRSQGVNCFEVPMARGFGGRRDVAALRALRGHLKAHSYDAIHCHSTKAGFIGRLAAPLRVPVAETPRTAHFIAVSRHEARVLRRARLCDARRLSVIYNGVDLDDFDQLQEPHKPSSALTIACFGRLTRQKNQAALLRALPLVLREIPHAKLLLVGSGEDEHHLRALAAHLHIGEAVTFAGEIEEARPLYSQCDIVAAPSRWEGCPYSILEAMAARRAVVATEVGGVGEVVTPQSGIVYHAPNALSEHLISLARDAAWREQMGEAARHRIENHFAAPQMVAATVAVYAQL